MGAESFDVLLESPLSFISFATLLVEQGLTKRLGSAHHEDELHYVYEDDSHLIEFELSREAQRSRLAVRFALCQSRTVDEIFITLVTRIASAARADLTIKAEVSDEDEAIFQAARSEEAESALRHAANHKRTAWNQDFAGRDTKASCDEAVRRFLIDR